MDEIISFQPQRDATISRLADVASQTKLLKHIEARIPAGEKVLFTGLYTENGIMNFFFVLPAIILGMAGIGVLIHYSDITGSSVLLLSIATISIIGAWLVRRRFPGVNCFSIVVLTDKAVHVCHCGQGYNISDIQKRSTSWQDVKAVVVERGSFINRNCKTRAISVLRYEQAYGRGAEFRFAAEPATFKRVVESVLHNTNPVAAAARQYREKVSGGNEVDAGKVCERVKPWRRPDWKKRVITLLTSLMVTSVVAHIEQHLLALTSIYALPAGVAITTVILVICGLILLKIAVQMTYDVLACMIADPRYASLPGSTIEAKEESIAWNGAAGPVFAPYNEALVVEPRWMDRKRGFVLVYLHSHGSDRAKKVRLGPVGDPWALYYAISERLEAWLARNEYFFALATLGEMATTSGRIQASIAAIVQSTTPGLDPPELKIKKKASVDTVARLTAMPVPQAQPLACFTTALDRSPAFFADFLDAGEQVHLVICIGRKWEKVAVVATTRQLLVTNLSGAWTRQLPYFQITYSTVVIKGWFVKHAKATIHTKPMGDLELNNIPLASPLVAVLASVARVPVLPK